MTYNWQQENWPGFSYDLTKVEEKLYRFSEKIGVVSGVLKAIRRINSYPLLLILWSLKPSRPRRSSIQISIISPQHPYKKQPTAHS